MRNLKVEPRVSVRIGDQGCDASARVVEGGTDEDALARRLLVAKYQEPGATDLESWGRTALAVAVDLVV